MRPTRSPRNAALAAASTAWVVALAAACARSPIPEPVQQVRPVPAAASANAAPATTTLSVLSLNDLHGRIGALPAFGGYVEALKRAQRGRGQVIAVDAGDMFQGTIGSNKTEGKSVIQAYNALGIVAAALGNHEFDYGPVDAGTSPTELLPQGALRARVAEANFPFLSANLFGADGAIPLWNNLLPRARVRAGGIEIGFVGVLTRETPSIVMPDYFAGLSVGELAPAVIKQAEALRRDGAEVVITIAHAGAECGRFDDPNDLESCDAETSELCALVRDVPRGLVDAWIGGHTHAGIGHFVNGAPVIEAFSRGKAFGRVDLELGGAPRRVVSARPYPPEPLCPDTAELAPCPTHAYAGQEVEPSAAVAAIIEPVLEWSRRERERSLNVEIADRLGAEHDVESELGNLFTDLMLSAVPGADLALSNGGSLRAPIPAGTLNYGALYEAMPFDNRVVKLSLTAAELEQVLKTHLSHDSHGLVSVSGIKVVARCNRGSLEVELFRKNGKAIADAERLSLVTSDYLATGGDRLFAPLGEPRLRIAEALPILMRDVLASELTKLTKISARDVLDPKQPRLKLPSVRPVRCAG